MTPYQDDVCDTILQSLCYDAVAVRSLGVRVHSPYSRR
eukprot:COSAG01_NODE_6125_length_3838_cov_1.407328_6_plen_38_part_00